MNRKEIASLSTSLALLLACGGSVDTETVSAGAGGHGGMGGASAGGYGGERPCKGCLEYFQEPYGDDLCPETLALYDAFAQCRCDACPPCEAWCNGMANLSDECNYCMSDVSTDDGPCVEAITACFASE